MEKQRKKTYSKPIITFQDIDFGVYGNYGASDDVDNIRDVFPILPNPKHDESLNNRG